MDCRDLDDRLEELADGQPPGGDLAAHLDACPACQARLRLARSIERVLQAREMPEPPPRFTAAVMSRVQRERWRSEQLVDAGFNVLMAIGLSLIVGGLAALAWSFGWFSIDPAAVRVVADAAGLWLAQVSGQLQMVVVAALLLTSALCLWWWVEGERGY